MADVKQMEKTILLITSEVSLRQCVCELVFGVDVFDLNLLVQIASVKQPVKSNSVGSGYVSHCRTSAFDDHFNHCFVVLENKKALHQNEKTSRSTKHNQHYTIQECRAGLGSWFDFGCACFWFGEEWNTSITKSQRSRAGIPSMREPAS